MKLIFFQGIFSKGRGRKICRRWPAVLLTITSNASSCSFSMTMIQRLGAEFNLAETHFLVEVESAPPVQLAQNSQDGADFDVETQRRSETSRKNLTCDLRLRMPRRHSKP